MSLGWFPYDMAGRFQDVDIIFGTKCWHCHKLACIHNRIGKRSVVHLMMLAFTTVGSTKFDALVGAVLSKPVLAALRLQGYTTLVVQCGMSEVDLGTSGGKFAGDMTKLQKDGLDIEIWKFKPSLDTEYDRADLVISHAGVCHLSRVVPHAHVVRINRFGNNSRRT
jgi:hypothetical protein